MSFNEMLEAVKSFLTTSGWKIFELLATLLIGILLIKLLIKIIKASLIKSPMDNTTVSFIVSILRFVLYVVLAFILANLMDIPMTSFVAVVSAVGLAVGLALQNSLSNLANGVVIIGTKPFREGDLVEIGSITGKVKAIRMLTVELVTVDNKKVVLPNSQVTNGVIVNYSARLTRRVDMKFNVAYGTDPDAVYDILREIIEANPLIQRAPEPFVQLTAMASSSVDFTVRVWANNDDYWTVYHAMQEEVYRAFTQRGIEIPFNQTDVHIRDYPETPKETLPFSQKARLGGTGMIFGNHVKSRPAARPEVSKKSMRPVLKAENGRSDGETLSPEQTLEQTGGGAAPEAFGGKPNGDGGAKR